MGGAALGRLDRGRRPARPNGSGNGTGHGNGNGTGYANGNGGGYDRSAPASDQVIEPGTGEPMAEVADAGAEDARRAVDIAHRAFEEGTWPRMSATERGRVLLHASALLRERLDDFAAIESRNAGKPINAARGEIAKVEDRLAEHEYMVGRFYLRYRLPPAAIGRFEKLLEDYPSYQGRDRALYHLGIAYRAAKRADDAQSTFSKLREQYPDSEWAAKVPEVNR